MCPARKHMALWSQETWPQKVGCGHKEAPGHDWQWPRPEGSRIKDMREHGLEGVRRWA